ncbi:MAG: sulfurtransferase [Lentimicrobiaceae bacterium]|jgi:thiosulfate/3-mercaptopyruvate sulfurtransferase|nr:sulfurtransferase [Lentimicrobiaceae bacterium]MBT3454875.1 sulfurtransferase [Lentimicrobiaceae bacterium]MBT3818498.1 sulfurtransferase [Lentimicrobiaceae bacterium]MBT4060866.1 sulfurtransferase [Lentimicrobiaceae bacterium]MBT4190539.1 sulfurtransferase [Lentimicrobiaceae bacterium]
MKKLTYILLSGLLVVLYSSSIMAQGDIISAADFMKMFKTNKNIIIVDASKADSYKKTHVKGAVNIPHKTLYKDTEIEGLIHDPAILASIFGSKGVSETKTIVVYDGGSQKYSSRVYWILKYLGAPDVKILQKDMAQWRKSRVPITKMPSKVAKATFTPKVNSSIYADIADVKSGKAVIVDARTTEEFDGTSDKSAGHIPGAINIGYKEVLNATEGFKNKAEMEAFVAKYKLSADKPILVYCNTGVIAAVIYVGLTDVMGWTNVKIYDGAYKEWGGKGNQFENKAGVLTTKKVGGSGGGC